MARNYDGANDKISWTDNASYEGGTLTGFAWSYVDNVTQDHNIFNKQVSTNYFNFFNDDIGAISGRTNTYKIDVGDGTDIANIEGATNAEVVTTWQSVLFIFVPANAAGLELWVNGVEDANSPVATTLVGSAGDNTGQLLTGETTGGTQDRAGRLSHTVLWNINLGDAQKAALSRGVCPFVISTTKPVFYGTQEGNDSTEVNYSQTGLGTLTGTTKAANNPPVEHMENYL